MTRSARWSIANRLYHVMNRGLEKRDMVRDDLDRHEWMWLLDRGAMRLGSAVDGLARSPDPLVRTSRGL